MSSSSLFSTLDERTAISFLHLCRYTLKVAQVTKSIFPQKCLLWLTAVLAKAKLHSLSKGQEVSLSNQLKELKDFVVHEYGQKVSRDFCLQEMVSYCQRSSQKEKGLAALWRQLGKETSLLLKAIQVGSLDYFVSSSKSGSYLQ